MSSRAQKALTIGAAFALAIALGAPAFAQVIVAPGYPYRYRYAAPDAAVKFDVKPKQAAVYVDGYYAGLVDDYDGAFQRLRTAPGGHEITLYLEGYRTHSEKVYLAADNTFKMKFRMEKLQAGDVAERPPAPQPPPQNQAGPADQGALPRGRVRRGPAYPYPPYPPNAPYPPNGPDNAGAPLPDQAGPPPSSGRGTLALNITPGDAELIVDDAPWKSDNASGHLTIDLSEGRHNIQIRKAGYVGYLTDVQIRAGQTTNLDVALKTPPSPR